MENEKHIMASREGRFYQYFKKWDLTRIEAVLIRMGATYWEIG